MKKSVIIFLIVLSQNIYAQKYFAECKITSNYWTSGTVCVSDLYYKNLKIISPINAGNHNYSSSDVQWYQSGNFTSTSKTVYAKVTKGQYISLECNTEDFGESKKYLDTYVTGATTFSQLPYTTNKWTGWNFITFMPTCNHHGTVTFQVTTYGAAEISNVNGSVGGSHCISSINDNIAINLSAVNPSYLSQLYLWVYTAGSSTLDGKQENFTDHKLKLENSYFYRIKVIYENGTISGFSDEINVKL